MKKLIHIILTAAILAVLLTASVSAENNYLPRVIDETGTLTRTEISNLNSDVASFRQSYGMDCVLLMIDSLGGETAQDYADDYYDYNGYGMGADNSGVLFLISIGDRECYISTCGDAINRINDYEIELILDDAVYYLADDDWYGGFRAFIKSAGRMIETDNNKYPQHSYDGYPEYGGDHYYSATPQDTTHERLLIVFIAPAVIAVIAVAVMCYMMNNARGKATAADYAVRGSFKLNGALDILISRHVSRTPRMTDNGTSGGHGGGGSIHISHSGISHGGGGRHF